MRTFMLSAFLLAALPSAGRADRGALTVEAGPLLTFWPAWGPAVGKGPGVTGTTAGALGGVRYGLRNDLELTLSGFLEWPATYTNAGATFDTAAGTLSGTSVGTVRRWGASAGARWVHGLEWRWFLGAEVGWQQERLSSLDFVDVSDPAAPRSFGLGLRRREQGALLVEPLLGIEWQVTDRWSVTVAPRFAVAPGSKGAWAVMVPVSVGWSWFGF